MAEDTRLYPPIIDNTIGAFELKKAQDGKTYMPIKLYF